MSTSDDWLDRTRAALARPSRTRTAPVVAVLELVEGPQIEAQFGRRGVGTALAAVAQVAVAELTGPERIAVDGHGRLLLLLRGAADWQLRKRLRELVSRLTRIRVRLGDDQLQVSPVCGYATAADLDARPAAGETFEPCPAQRLLSRAVDAADVAAEALDLIPRHWDPARPSPRKRGLPPALRTTLQVLATVVAGTGIPFLALLWLYRSGIDLTTPAYLVVTASLVITACLIWAEGFQALDPVRPPDEPATPYPAASAIIPAYLPNEAATIVDTIKAFLAVDYPARLQTVLVYNTPHPMPVEAELRELAARHPDLIVLEVPFSTSKAQNVNAGLQVVDGEFTGIFDADHHPAPDAFRRAWRWLSHGADVVQGHCVIRNGDASRLARTVAIEFESIYAVSHPGRAKLHGFGIFGGSNGFWRTSVLHETRMHREMLTEDIDSSLRALLDGREVVSDPALVSRELAPATIGAWWHQRMRWAQGWFQVSRRHLLDALRSPRLTLRNKLGVTFLLGWREVHPWLSLQILPVIAFMAWRSGGPSHLDWVVPMFVLTSLYTLSVGPGQVLFAWRLAAPEIRRRRVWFWAYLVTSMLVYTEAKNMIGRAAQLKELVGEHRWVVTPRDLKDA